MILIMYTTTSNADNNDIIITVITIDIDMTLRGEAPAGGASVGLPADALLPEELRGNHLATTTCLTQAFFKRGE